jgi:hypothetical protein
MCEPRYLTALWVFTARYRDLKKYPEGKRPFGNLWCKGENAKPDLEK